MKTRVSSDCFEHIVRYLGTAVSKLGFESVPSPLLLQKGKEWTFFRNREWKTDAIQVFSQTPNKGLTVSIAVYLGPRYLGEGDLQFSLSYWVDGADLLHLVGRRDDRYRLPILKTQSRCERVGAKIAGDISAIEPWFDAYRSIQGSVERIESGRASNAVPRGRVFNLLKAELSSAE